jgi:hypothetical protein
VAAVLDAEADAPSFQLPGVADGEDAADALAAVPGDATPDLRTLTAD